MIFTRQYLNEVIEISKDLDETVITKAVDILSSLQGRLFILGVGGSAANASHAVNDFRKIAGIETYAPTDNVAELTARTNDNGWPTVFSDWLRVSKFNSRDVLMVLSVGGGTDLVSQNISEAVWLANSLKAKIIAIVGRPDGYAAKLADACILIPIVNPDRVTPHTESFQAIVWHLLVNHPKLKDKKTKAVFLDRDGTLNRLVYGRPPLNTNEIAIFPDALPALKRLKDAGFKLIVVTNQPDVGRGLVEKEWVEEVNKAITDNLPVDKIYCCFHDDVGACDCRKPKPGMLFEAAEEFNIDLKKSRMIGDSPKDQGAAVTAGLAGFYGVSSNISLTDAVEAILKDSNGH